MLKRELNLEAKELIIVVDMVNGFCKEGNLASPSMMKIVPRQIEVLKKVNKDQAQIVFIRDCHTTNSVEFKTFGEHCLDDTLEVEVIDELKEFVTCEYYKNCTNFMFSEEFVEDLKKYKNLEKVLIMGVLSDICVKNGAISIRNYFDQHNLDIEVCVFEDLIDTYDAANHKSDIINEDSLKDMESNGIIRIKGR